MVSAPAGDFADEDTTDMESIPGHEGSVHAGGEDPGLQAEAGIVDRIESLSIVREGFQYQYGGKSFLAGERVVGGDVVEDGRREDISVLGWREEESRALESGGVDPCEGSCGFLFVDEGTNDGFGVIGIATGEFLCGEDESLGSGIIDGIVEEEALDADAALAGLGEGGGGDAIDGLFVGKGIIDEASGISAEFEGDLFFAGARLEIPTDGIGAGKGEELDARVGREGFSGGAGGGKDGVGVGREGGFAEDVA